MPRRSTQNLTKKFLDEIQPEDGKDFVIWDAKLTGFGIRVKPSGRKSFLFKYRTQDDTQRKYTLGSYGQLTVEQARKLAQAGLGKVANGEDPSLERQEQKRSMTVSQLSDRYYSDAVSGKLLYRGKPKKESTLAIDRGRIERHIKPLLGKKRIEQLKRADIEKFMFDIRDGKTSARIKTGKYGLARVQGGMGTAKKAVNMLSAIYNYAIKNGLIETNPCQHVERPADKKRTRFLNPEEYARLGAALQDEQFTIQYETARWAISVLALTGCRRNEILNLRREEVDIEGRCLRLSDTKTGAQIRPCGNAALDILERQLALHSRDWIFPSPKTDGSLVNIRMPMYKLCELAGLDEVTPHTLRHSYATIAHELGYSELTIAGLLGHNLATVTSRYAHHIDHVLADAADQVSGMIFERMSVS